MDVAQLLFYWPESEKNSLAAVFYLFLKAILIL